MKRNSDLWRWKTPSLKKFFMELKIAILIVLASVSNIFATPTYSQVAKLNISMGNARLEQVMDEIEKQSEFYFLFNQKLIDVNRVVDVNIEGKLIDNVLSELFTGTNVNYSVMNRQILLTTDPLLKLADLSDFSGQQTNTVKGTVKDSQGRPLVGVNVIEKETTNGAITMGDGVYSLKVAGPSSVLVFKFVGMISQEVVVGNNTDISITLVEDMIGMEEVVVIGYGTAKKS